MFEHEFAGFSEEMLEMILLALEDLRNSLTSQGSNLMVRLGNAEYVMQKLVREVGCYVEFPSFFFFFSFCSGKFQHLSTHQFDLLKLNARRL